MRILLILFFAASCWGQMLQAIVGQAPPPSGTPPISIVNTVKKSAVDANPVTTSPVSMTGASLLVVACATNGVTSTVSSSPANTWTAGASETSNGWSLQTWYAYGPTVSATQTFTCDSGGWPVGIYALGLAGTILTSSVLDGTPTAIDTAASQDTCQPGAVTPTQAGSAFIAFTGFADTGNTSIAAGSPFADLPILLREPTTGMGVGVSVFLAGTASAQNPTLTSNYAGGWKKCALEAFKNH